MKNELLVPAHVLCDLHDPRADASYLERMVTACGRTSHSLLGQSTLPAPSRIIEDAFSGPSSFTKLLPGGRFLISGASQSPEETLASSVFLWDLSKDTSKPVSTVTFEMPVLLCNFSTSKEMDMMRLIVSTGHR